MILKDILFCYLVVWVTFMPIMFVAFMTHQVRYLRAYYNGKFEFDALAIICMIANSIGPTFMWPFVIGRNVDLDGEF